MVPRRVLASLLATAAVASIAGGGCTTEMSEAERAAAPGAAWRGRADSWGFIPEAAPSLRVVVSGPRTAPYLPSLLGAGPLAAAVRVKNVGTARTPLPKIVLSFRAVRDGVPFVCATSGPRSREPHEIGPGETTWLERELDCSLPVPGRYEIEALMAAGDGASSRPLEEAGAFVTEVASSPRAPAAYPGRAGLYVVVAGPSPVRPMPADRWAREGYVGLLAVTNAGRTAAAFGDVHVDLDVRRGGESVDCVPGAREVGLPGPTTLPPGHTFLARFPVRCDLSTTADHELLAAVTVGGALPGGPACNVPAWPIAVTEDGFNDRDADPWRFDDRTGKNPFGL